MRHADAAELCALLRSFGPSELYCYTTDGDPCTVTATTHAALGQCNPGLHTPYTLGSSSRRCGGANCEEKLQSMQLGGSCCATAAALFAADVSVENLLSI